MVLYHFSDSPDIRVFEPRVLNHQLDEVAKVWAIDEYHAPHYYFPRECPRICVWPKGDTTQSDLEKYIGMSGTRRMAAIESAWYDRMKAGHIYRYTFDPEDFEAYNENAGYYITTRTVKPIDAVKIDDLVKALLMEEIELRIIPSLLPLQEAILKSSMNFSMIRLRNAKVRPS